jgi:hypothetical protein
MRAGPRSVEDLEGGREASLREVLSARRERLPAGAAVVAVVETAGRTVVVAAMGEEATTDANEFLV